MFTFGDGLVKRKPKAQKVLPHLTCDSCQWEWEECAPCSICNREKARCPVCGEITN